MEGISDLRISGIDETRPPLIRKEPYINLYFTLSHKAPPGWCDDFNRLLAHRQYPIKVDPDEGLYVESWVRKPEEIAPLLEILKEAVQRCNNEYIARIQAASQAEAQRGSTPADEGPQGQLNRIIAGLNFDD
ncbi:MAG: hypothetical protein K0A95_06795 [Chromatiales bacterium]|nr:hypothetical protein [Gammaproteobacteria bacterium]MBW6476762.1 hypothetical protein [Chromatiales bacterium]